MSATLLDRPQQGLALLQQVTLTKKRLQRRRPHAVGQGSLDVAIDLLGE